MRVYVHGNCQAPAIAHLLKQSQPLWDIASYEIFGEKIISEIDRYHHYAETSDIIISQPVHENYRGRSDLSSNWLKSIQKRDADFIMFPSMFFDGQLVGTRSLPVSAYGMPYHDVLFVHLATAEVPFQDLSAIFLDEQLYSEAFIQNEIALSIAELRRRELHDGIDISILPYISEHVTSTQVFHVINHPYRPVLAYAANEILKLLGFAPAVPYIGDELLRFPHIPCLPSVERYLRRNCHENAVGIFEHPNLYHLPKERLTPLEYWRLAYDHLATTQGKEIRKFLIEPHVQPFLDRVAAAVPSIPHITQWRSI